MSHQSCLPTLFDYVNIINNSEGVRGGSALLSIQSETGSSPLVTVFTVVLNAHDTLQATIDSVHLQTYQNIQYIIIDGGSTDGTLDVIKSNDSVIHTWLSQADTGTADATNKAIALAKGKYVFWLSAGDCIDVDFIEIAVQGLINTGADLVFGRVTYYDHDTKLYTVRADQFDVSNFSTYPSLNYQTWVISRDCFNRIGLLDTRYKVFCDFEWGLRLRRSGGRGQYIENLNINFQCTGLTERNLILGELEGCRILREYGTNSFVAYFYFCSRIIRTYLRRFTKLILPQSHYDLMYRFVRRNYIIRE